MRPSNSAWGGPELAGAVRASRQLVSLEPLRESGYRYLMQALAAEDNLAEALQVYGQLCDYLRGTRSSHRARPLACSTNACSPPPEWQGA